MILFKEKLLLCLALSSLVFSYACVQQPSLRRPVLVREAPPAPEPSPAPATPDVAEPVAEGAQPLLSDDTIREQNLGASEAPAPFSGAPSPPAESTAPSEASETMHASLPVREARQPGPAEAPPAASEAGAESFAGPSGESSRTMETPLVAMITPETPARTALSLRLAEEGRKLLEREEYHKGLSQLEKAISLEARNRYAYYYLAQAHYALGRHRQSLNFLDIAHSYFLGEPLWLARILVWQGKNYEALESFQRADRSYVEALYLDPANRAALERITRMEGRSPASGR